MRQKKSRLKLRNFKCQYGFSALSFHAIVVGSCKVKFVFFFFTFWTIFLYNENSKKIFFPDSILLPKFHDDDDPSTKHKTSPTREKCDIAHKCFKPSSFSHHHQQKKPECAHALSNLAAQEFHATRPSMSLVVIVVRDGRSLAKGKCCGLPIPFLPPPPTTTTTTMTNYESIRLWSSWSD